MDQGIAQFADRIRAAAAGQRPLRIRGGGSKDFYGGQPAGELLECAAYAGIIDYEPSELVVTARCGTPLSELEAALRANGQMLAFEPPHFSERATVGGMLAAGLSGPRRQAAGALRDFALGMRVMDARGEAMSFGGRVMKNVAGYDVSRLMAGSLGTLGLILEASIKTLPLPAAEATLRFELPEDKAIEMLNRWGGKPLPITASAWVGGELTLRLGGALAAVRAAAERLGGERVDDMDLAAAFWHDVREQRNAFFRNAEDQGMPLWRLSLPSTTPPAALGSLPTQRFIEWGGAQRWFVGNADARTVRQAAVKAGGDATLFRGGDKSIGVFQPLSPALMGLHRKVKAAFDPQCIFNLGRLYPDL